VSIPQGAITALREAQHVFVLTGSGVSAESGVPTFRDAQSGLWSQYNPLELATTEAFLNDPALVWRWYRWRRELVAKAAPNPGHRALARLAGAVPKLTLVTQNVDGLHQKAGSADVIEFHGNIFDTRCLNENVIVPDADDSEDVPYCPNCRGLLRPGVVWFGEAIPAAPMETALAAALQCDVFLSIGTSSTVWPAAGLAQSAAGNGATLIEINPEATPLSADSVCSLQGKSGEVLPELLDCLPL